MERHLLAISYDLALHLLDLASDLQICPLVVALDLQICPLDLESDLWHQRHWIVERRIVGCNYRSVFNVGYRYHQLPQKTGCDCFGPRSGQRTEQNNQCADCRRTSDQAC